MKLNKYQEAVISLSDGDHLVIAPAGTGKTAILANRFRLALESSFDLDKMLCITFTNRAAKNMLDRIEINNEGEIYVGNIHSICFRLLKEKELIGADTTVLSQEESDAIIKYFGDTFEDAVELDTKCFQYIRGMYSLSECFPDKKYPDLIANYGSFLKQTLQKRIEFLLKDVFKENSRLTVEQKKNLIQAEKIRQINAFKKVNPKYTEYKNTSILLDFDDILYRSLFNRKEIEGRFSWIQCDEAQDFNALQFYLINTLSSEAKIRVYFADYEQLIFEFLGSSDLLIDSITTRFNKHYLIENYRSSKNLVEFLNDYASYNNLNKWIEPSYSNIREPSSFNQHTILNENQFLDLINSSTDSISILVRTNKEVKEYSNFLRSNNVEHLRLFDDDIFKSKSFSSLSAALSVLLGKISIHNQSEIIRLLDRNIEKGEAYSLSMKLYQKGYFLTDGISYDSQNPFDVLNNCDRKIIFDTETTGLNPRKDEVIQFSSLTLPGSIENDIYLQTDKFSSEAQEVHNISEEFLNEYGIERELGTKRIQEIIHQSQVLIGHNVKFDKAFLAKTLGEKKIEGILFVDTIDLTRRIYPRLPKYKLEYLLETFNLIGVNSHNAIEDVRATNSLLSFLRSQEKSGNLEGKEKKLLDKFKAVFRDLFLLVDKYYYEPYEKSKAEEIILEICDRLKLKKIRDIHIDFLLDYCKQDTIGNTLFEFLHSIWKVNEGDLADRFRIIISTVHRAKGLQFNTVIIPDLELYPYWFEKEDEDLLKTSKRVLYVALSRASRHIHTVSKSDFMPPNIN